MSIFDRIRYGLGYVLMCMGVSRPPARKPQQTPQPPAAGSPGNSPNTDK